MVAADPLLLLLFLLKAVLGLELFCGCSNNSRVHRLYQEQGKGRMESEAGSVPLNLFSQFYFPSLFPILLPQPAKVVGL